MDNKTPQNMRSQDIFLPDCSFRTHIIANQDNVAHYHDYVEAFYILQGSIIHCCNGNEKLLTTGDLMIVSPYNDTHYFKRIESTHCEHRDIMFTTELYESACRFLHISNKKLFAPNNLNLRYSALSLKEIDYFEEMIKNILLFSSKDLNNQNILINTLAVNMLAKVILKNELPQQQQNVPPWFNSFLALFTKADIIKEGLPYLKKYMLLSYEHVGRLHKKILGTTIVEHLTEVRMVYAAHLLRTSDLSILQIAMDVGYNSLSHFNHTFKKRYNLSPNAYKTQILY